MSIAISLIQIDSTAENISFDISGNNLTKIELWKGEDYERKENAIDLSSFIPVPVGNVYTWSLSLDDVGIESFCGIFFIEFTDDNETKMGMFGNFKIFFDCMLRKAINITLTDCNKRIESCNECENDISGFMVLHFLLNNIATLNPGQIIRMVEYLFDICNICGTCPQEAEYISGYGIGMELGEVIVM